MNFPENTNEGTPFGGAGVEFGATIMELILDLGPAPISSIGLIAMSSGVTPFEASGAMAMIQAAGLVEVHDTEGNVVIDPNDGVAVALTALGERAVLACRAADHADKEERDSDPREGFGGRINPNYN